MPFKFANNPTIIGAIFLMTIIFALGFVNFILTPHIDNTMNVVTPHTPYNISETAQKLHSTIPVTDLHADTLLWKRNPQKRHHRGQTDFPRFREGGVAVQVFTTVTKSPPDLNYEENNADKDDVTALAIAQMWPPRTWNSIFERALYQAERLNKIAKDDKDFYIIRTQSDLKNILMKRQKNKNIFAGILGMEGAHPLQGKLSNLDPLYDIGFRVIGLQHFFDNDLGGSLHGISESGLTSFGREVIKLADRKHMIIDVAHSSPAVVRETLALTSRPIIVSHTGFAGHCPSRRNISDELIKAITQKGGLIGVGFWQDVICDASPMGIASALKYGVDNFGTDHIALGSDFDGTVTTTLDTSELAAITHELLQLGMDEKIIAKVMGENAIAFFQKNLPSK